MREKTGLPGRRRFRPGWMEKDADAGVDNPAMTLDPVASFSLGDADDSNAVDASVTINVSDYDDKQDTSLV